MTGLLALAGLLLIGGVVFLFDDDDGGGSSPDTETGDGEPTNGPDSLTGTDGGDFIRALTGNDTISGLDGDDTLSGGNGADVVSGDGGNDLAQGGRGRDTLSGNAGDDLLFDFQGVDEIFGGIGNDTLVGTVQAGNSASEDTDGGDQLEGGSGEDVLIYGMNDTLTGGDAAEDSLTMVYDASAGPVPVVTVRDFADGTGATILLDDVAVANVTGTQGLDPAEVTLEATPGTEPMIADESGMPLPGEMDGTPAPVMAQQIGTTEPVLLAS